MINEMQDHSILIVDDEPEMRAALSHALNRSGFSVESASNGHEALEKIKAAMRMYFPCGECKDK